MFSSRTRWSAAANRLATATEQARRSGRALLDLTIANPTLAGIPYPHDAIARCFDEAARQPYRPEPKGDQSARAAIAAWYAQRGRTIDPESLVLTASTSEAYGWLFKLLCEPGDRVLVPRPSYPLFEFLAGLEMVGVAHYPLRYGSRWEIDFGALGELLKTDADRKVEPGDAGTGRFRALVVVDPNNPTGSFLAAHERTQLDGIAADRDLPLIIDEVFATYPLEGARAADSGPLTRTGPTFILDGLSKSAGLPGVKAGWIIVSGPEPFRSEALARLEIIGDTYLSIGGLVQAALPALLEIGRATGGAILARVEKNLSVLRSLLPPRSSVEVLRVEGGWSAVLRVPRTVSEDDWCLSLLEEDGVLVQPGWYFDFESEAYLIVSLLTPETPFADGIARVAASRMR